MENDVYILKITQNYVVLNDNYEGLIVLDKNLNFNKKIHIDDDFFIYQAYSSELNDYIIVQDMESDILYSINIETNSVRKINLETIFSTYYYVENDMFSLFSKGKKYEFTYDELKEMKSYNENLIDRNILSNWQENILYNTKSNELIYNNKVIHNPPVKVEEYKINSNLILSYSEKYLCSYCQGEWILLYEVGDKYSIRECTGSSKYIYVLVNDKSDVNESLVKVIPQNATNSGRIKSDEK
ncbi:hypothetical protein [Enterococcus ureasiticus]|uniref:DUF5050 domain-containing protein n=1 Tax=Enterococcus ureasiticus TaxID=903984 RepID=A0A1E5GMJ2_9ENTE|nr:hypothetical protein [Enterococcus ureasiticus]OEG13450.1 hypothetical protein BCR21_00200 [Enterococcus ureasiticus]